MTRIVFDLGGVLADPAGKVEALAAHWGVDPETLAVGYWAAREPYDGGATNHAYFTEVARHLGLEVDEALADELGRVDATNWVAIRPAAEAILADLAAAGVPTAILSNAPTEIVAALEAAPWRRHVGPLFVSGAVGHVKPTRGVFDHVAEALGEHPGTLLFIDDKQENVDGAIAAGWRGELWTSDEATREFLVAEGLLPREPAPE